MNRFYVVLTVLAVGLGASGRARWVGRAAGSHWPIRTVTNRGVLGEGGTGGGTGRHESILRGADRAGRRVGRFRVRAAQDGRRRSRGSSRPACQRRRRRL